MLRQDCILGFLDPAARGGSVFAASGLALEGLGVSLTAERASTFSVSGPQAARAEAFARAMCEEFNPSWRLSHRHSRGDSRAYRTRLGHPARDRRRCCTCRALPALICRHARWPPCNQRGQRSGIGVGAFEQGRIPCGRRPRMRAWSHRRSFPVWSFPRLAWSCSCSIPRSGFTREREIAASSRCRSFRNQVGAFVPPDVHAGAAALRSRVWTNSPRIANSSVLSATILRRRRADAFRARGSRKRWRGWRTRESPGSAKSSLGADRIRHRRRRGCRPRRWCMPQARWAVRAACSSWVCSGRQSWRRIELVPLARASAILNKRLTTEDAEDTELRQSRLVYNIYYIAIKYPRERRVNLQRLGVGPVPDHLARAALQRLWVIANSR